MSELENVDLKKGFSFNFENSGNEITLKCSSYTGLEEVFVNDKLVTSKKSYSKNSTQTFEFEENSFSIDLITESILKGPIVCTLNKNGIPQKKKQIVFKLPDKNDDQKNSNYKKYAIGALLGVLFVVIKINLELPFESFFYFLGAVFVYFFVFEYLKQDDPVFSMEEVEVK